VPTWNYVTVHAAGTLSVHHEAEWLRAHVGRLVQLHESARPEPWAIADAPDDYIASQLRAIVGIEMSITRLDAKRKLGQNRSSADTAGVIAGLANGLPMEQAVAAEMGGDSSAG
jgi:transcriptional regulator